MIDNKKIAVLIPCYNEALVIAEVIKDFQASLPNANIYVYDNNSTDNTSVVAAKAGAIVCFEGKKGKGNVVRRMFRDIDADFYLMVDGDRTYDPKAAPLLLNHLCKNSLDMVVGTRKSADDASYRKGHRFGNYLFTYCVRKLFGQNFSDILSGYRAFSRRFVKSFPCMSDGFEIETELTVHAIDLQLPVGELETTYFARVDGSVSKLSTYKDGFNILKRILLLTKELKPFYFFGTIFLILFVLSLILAIPIVITFLDTGLVPRFPTAILAASLMVLAFLNLLSGIILDSVSRGRRESKLLQYLKIL